jgi:L-threonylcarbamoyladenylate synthase
MRIDVINPDPGMLAEAVRVVRRGGVVLYPADTIYGLGCDPFNPEAVSRLMALKGRDEGKGCLVLIPNNHWLDRLAAEVPTTGRALCDRFWPGPLTVVTRALPTLPPGIRSRGGTVGLRRPRNPFLEAWLDLLGSPLVSTSANRSGEPYTGDPTVLRSLFEPGVDLFLDAGELPERPPSTVVDLTTSPFRLLRAGEQADAVRAELDRLSAESPESPSDETPI